MLWRRQYDDDNDDSDDDSIVIIHIDIDDDMADVDDIIDMATMAMG
jgi:hypothetical protein